MKQKLSIILSFLIFLIALFLFKIIIPALIIAIVFFLLVFLLEAWFPKQFKRTKDFLRKELFLNKKLTRKLLVIIFFTALLSLAAFSLVYLPIEFLITEVWLLIPKIHPIIGILTLLMFVLLFSLIDWFKLFSQKKFLIYFFLLITLVGLFSFREIRLKKLARENLPKIYRISRKSGIQGQIVKIEGVNFSPPSWKRGKVILDGEEMIVRLWDDKLIIAEQQVPHKFGVTELYLVRDDEVESNRYPFEIKNPDEFKLQ